MYTYLTNCVSAKGEDIEKMCGQAVEVPYRELEHHIGIDVLLEMFGDTPMLNKDLAVSFYRSKYLGVDVYYVEHSAIEYVFAKEETNG